MREQKSCKPGGLEATRVARCLVAEVLCVQPSNIALDHHLLDDLAMDSLEVLDLAMRLDERWGVGLDEDQFRQITHVRDVAILLHSSVSCICSDVAARQSQMCLIERNIAEKGEA